MLRFNSLMRRQKKSRTIFRNIILEDRSIVEIYKIGTFLLLNRLSFLKNKVRKCRKNEKTVCNAVDSATVYKYYEELKI